MSEPLSPATGAQAPPPPPTTRSLEIVLREALEKGAEVRVVVGKGLADGALANPAAYANVEVEGVALPVPKLAGAQIGGPSSGYPVYLLATKDFLLALGTVGPPQVGAQVPIGAAIPYGGLTAPPGYVLGDGSFYSKASYPALYAVYAGRYGDGGSTFGVPDLRRRVPVGLGAGGGYDLGVTEGLALGARGPYHHHHMSAGVSVSVQAVGDHQHAGVGDHSHGSGGDAFALTVGNVAPGGTSGSNRTLISSSNFNTGNAGAHTHPAAGGHGHSASGSVDGDTSGSNGQDSPAFIVLNYIIRAL
jgi:microcystin-dependent protein